MRIAMCFSGALRQFKTGYEYIKDYIKDYDVFFHTWDNKINYFKFQGDEGIKKEAIDLYKPIDYLIEEYSNDKALSLLKDSQVDKYLETLSFNWKNVKGKCFTSGGDMRNNVIAMFYGMYKVNELKKEYELKNKFKYDIVIRNRFDNIIFDPINKELLTDIKNNPNSIYIPMGYDPDDKDELKAVNDQFAMGGSDAMDTHMNLYKSLSNHLINRNNKISQPFYPLGLTKWHLVENDINIKRFYLNYVIHKRLGDYNNNKGVKTGYSWSTIIKPTKQIIND